MGRCILPPPPQTIIVLWGVVTLAFFMTHVVPGDPARLIAGPNASAEAVASIHRRAGSGSLGARLSTGPTWGSLLHGNLGTSFALQNKSVGRRILHALPVRAARARRSDLGGDPRRAGRHHRRLPAEERCWTGPPRSLSLVGLSAPPFWLGLLLLYVLAYKLSIFPLSGWGSPYWYYLILPSVHPRTRRRGLVRPADQDVR